MALKKIHIDDYIDEPKEEVENVQVISKNTDIINNYGKLLKQVEDIQWSINASKRKIICEILKQIMETMKYKFERITSFKNIFYKDFVKYTDEIKQIIINHTSVIEFKFDILVVFNKENDEKTCNTIINYLRQMLQQIDFTLVKTNDVLYVKHK